MSQRIDITYMSILRVIAVLAALTFLYFIRDILALILVSVFLAAAIMPWVNWFHKRNIPRALSVLIIYLSAFAVLALVIVLIIPPLSDQINQLSRSFPEYFQRVIVGFSEIQQFNSGAEGITSIQESLGSLQTALSSATQGVFSAVSSIFGGIIFFLAALVLTFYMVLNEELFMKFVEQITPQGYKIYAIKFIKRAQVKLGKWLRGQLFLMLFIGVLTYIGLLILGVKFALVLALIAGLLELVPYAGPIISAVPALVIALTQSPLMAVLVAILYFVIQQIENNVLVPKVMQKAVGLNPIVTIVAILVGAKLGGILGAILAVPVATVLSMFISDWREHKRSQTAS
jgi:predicted PurR-regulated permease PerM